MRNCEALQLSSVLDCVGLHHPQRLPSGSILIEMAIQSNDPLNLVTLLDLILKLPAMSSENAGFVSGVRYFR